MRSFLDRFVGNLSPSALLVSTFFWSWFDLVPFSPLLPQTAGTSPLPWLTVASLCLGAVPLIAYATSKRLRTLSLTPRFFALASLILGTAGSLFLWGGFTTRLPTLLAIGTVLTGLYQGTGAAVVGCIAVCQGKTNALIHIAACLPFNLIFVLLGMFLQPGAAVALCAALPLLSALSYKVFHVRGTNAQTFATVEKTTPNIVKPNRNRSHYGSYTILLFLVTAAFGFIEGQASAVESNDFGGTLLDYASLFIRGVCALVVFCAYVFYSKQPQTFLIVAIALMAAGLLALGPTVPLGPIAAAASHLLVMSGYAVFDLLIWAMLVIVHHGSPLSMYRFLCIAYAVDGLGIAGGMALATLLTQQSWMGLAAATLGGALLIAAFVVLSRPHSVRDNLRGTLPTENTTDSSAFEAIASSQEAQQTRAVSVERPNAIGTIASRYFLTAREECVLELLLAGRSAPYIAEQLCVSQNTIKTHVRHIYTKLDIHTRQELIDLVQSTAPTNAPR